MAKRTKTIEQQCADLNAASVRSHAARKATRIPLPWTLCGCLLSVQADGSYVVTKAGALVGAVATSREAQMLALRA